VFYVIFCAYKYVGVKKFSLIFGSALILGIIGTIEGLCWENGVNGWIGMCLSILLYGSSLQKLIVVCKNNNYFLLPVYISFIQVFGCSAWVTYGLLRRYITIIVPNVLGILFGIVGLVSYLVIRKRLKRLETMASNSCLSNSNYTELVIQKEN
jgi:solute carrier family 50 protein (sugar transporter)